MRELRAPRTNNDRIASGGPRRLALAGACTPHPWPLRRPLHETDANDGQNRRWEPASSAPTWHVHNDDAAAASRSQYRVARSEQRKRPLEQQRAVKLSLTFAEEHRRPLRRCAHGRRQAREALFPPRRAAHNHIEGRHRVRPTVARVREGANRREAATASVSATASERAVCRRHARAGAGGRDTAARPGDCGGRRRSDTGG
mmetsp:Transcript_36962/g.119315  ORF Transcript_36962/g.119315 Transcript_36962/m.119315 type:complete len:201 (-) Transcript_36962:585-1187(-)